MKKVLYTYHLIKRFSKKILNDHVSAYAAQSSFFIIVSFIPFIILMLSIIQYTPLSEQMLLTLLLEATPNKLHPLIFASVNSIYESSSFTLISITALITLWVAGKVFWGITHGLNLIYGVKESRNYIFRRLLASLYTFLLILVIVITLMFFVFSNQILYATKDIFPIFFTIVSVLLTHKIIITQCVLTFFFLLLYKFVPSHPTSLIRQFPGAFFAATGWQLFSHIYSIYVNTSVSFNAMYGNLAGIVFAMLWLYFCMTIFFYGAEINTFFTNTSL